MMRNQFAIIMPRIRGRTRGQLGPVPQSPCGLVIYDTAGDAVPALRDLCAEIELYARAGGVSTLRVAVAPPGAGRRGAAEILSGISTLRHGGATRVAVICAELPEPSPPISPLNRSLAERQRARVWDGLPDGVRVVMGLASAIGSVGEIARGVAAFSTGPVTGPVVLAAEPSNASEDPAPSNDAAASGANELPLPRDTTSQLARLLVTVPESALAARERTQVIGQIYGWMAACLNIGAARPSVRSATPAPHRRHPSGQISWSTALSLLDGAWPDLLARLAARDPARAERVEALMEARLAVEGGYAPGAYVRAVPTLRDHLDDVARREWDALYGSLLARVAPRILLGTRPPMPDDTTRDPAQHSAS